jgi:hypothetical protein
METSKSPWLKANGLLEGYTHLLTGYIGRLVQVETW